MRSSNPNFLGREILGEAVRPCRAIEGVQFTVVEQEVCIQALIPREVLESVFGAGDTPESWMRAYESNADAIDCAAADLYRARPTPGIVVLQHHLTTARGLRPGTDARGM
jgi:hypothetical protein